jgi:hypothetical protein
MGIKRKRSGPAPTYPELWQEIAKDPKRLDEARRMYRLSNPNMRLVEAHRIVEAFAKNHQEKFGRR